MTNSIQNYIRNVSIRELNSIKRELIDELIGLKGEVERLDKKISNGILNFFLSRIFKTKRAVLNNLFLSHQKKISSLQREVSFVDYLIARVMKDNYAEAVFYTLWRANQYVHKLDKYQNKE